MPTKKKRWQEGAADNQSGWDQEGCSRGGWPREAQKVGPGSKLV
jgi:hypothetical protein